EARDRHRPTGEGQRRAPGAVPRGGPRRLPEPDPGARRGARPRRDLPRDARQDGAGRQGALRGRRLRHVPRAHHRSAVRGRAHRRGRRRQDLRDRTGARRAHTHGRHRPRRRHAGGVV
ncbi:MAG: Nitrogen regulatory protein P-II, partial [uncultured Solirubrobacteraceae bacterium]